MERREYDYTTGELDENGGTAVQYTYGETDEAATAAEEDTYNEAWGDLLRSYNANAITYDPIGNPEVFGNRTFTWEHGRQLKSLTEGTTTWNYTYDAGGMRTGRSNGSSTYSYIYTGSQLTQMKKGTETLTFTYDASGIPLTITHGSNKYYYATNLQGDVVAILDAAGSAVAGYTYDAWGNCTVTGVSSIAELNPLRYRGYVYDQETKLYYLQSRYYDPDVGRFINADSLVATGQGFVGNNMFAYCLNNPVNFLDHDGKDAECALAWWGSTMWFLCLVDSILPVGDLAYAVTLISLAIVVAVSSPGSAPITNKNTEPSNTDKQNNTQASGGSASPKPPKKDDDPLSFSKEFKSDSVYNRDGVRIDYEYNGNGTGNIHVHTKQGKFHYDLKGYFKIGPGNSASAPSSIQHLLQIKAIVKAIAKALYIIRELGGKLV